MNAEQPTNAVGHLEQALARIISDNADLKIVTALDSGRALTAARASDLRQKTGISLGPLDGMLIGVKDNIAVRGMPWTAGLGYWRKRMAKTDASSVARLRAAGAIPVAMLNMHEAALGATTDNPHFGRTANPLDRGLTPGDSSGGSAAAIAAGFVDMALGSDTMGSVRIPAAYCGVVGLKPTRGLIGRGGLAYLSPTLDTVGMLAARVETLHQVLLALAGPDGDDPHSCALPADWQTKPLGPDFARLTVGVPRQLGQVECETAIAQGLAIARRTLQELGAQVVEADLAGWSPGPARRGGLMVCEAEGAVALADPLASKDDDAMSAGLRNLLDYGASLTSERLADAHGRIQAAAAAAARGLAQCDVLLLPTAPQMPFAHGSPAPKNQADFTALANFHGGPALALPVQVPSATIPASVQLMGPTFSDQMILAIGSGLQAALEN